MIKTQQMKQAFSLVTSLAVIVLMASVAILVLSLTSKTVKETVAQYKKEQAVLLAKSYTEYAIMAVTANDRVNNTCLLNVYGNNVLGDEDTDGGYNVRVNIFYIGGNSGDNNVSNCGSHILYSGPIQTPESPLQIIVDTYVEYKDIDNASTELITYHRRTLQKI
jgi:type II secretory pathway pseudopilin PulG